MAGRASIVGAAATHVGKVREHNEDAHFLDQERGVFLVCDGMGGHAAGEVASALAIRAICKEWASDDLRDVIEQWIERGTAEARKRLLEVIRGGVLSAHQAILAEADRDDSKSGMGTTLVGAMIVGGELLFAHAGDSRAYLVRDGISMQLTEDHTLLARLLAAGIDVDVSGEGSRFRSMLTNALGIGEECKVSTFLVPLADGDRFLLCSDGISEYVPENEVGDVLTKQPSPARAAQRLIDLALERGGGDNATAIVVRVLEAGETPLPAEQRKRDDAAVGSCALWGRRVTPQQRLRALRIAIPRDHGLGDKLPAHTLGSRVAWIIVEGELVQDGATLGPGALVYPESLVIAGEPPPLPDRDGLAVSRTEVRALAIRADDFREMCEDDSDLGESLLESLGQVIAKRAARGARDTGPEALRTTEPHPLVTGRDGASDAGTAGRASPGEAGSEDTERRRAATVPDDPRARARAAAESSIIAPVPPRAPAAPVPARPSPPPMPAPPRPSAPPSPPPAMPAPSGPPGPGARPGPLLPRASTQPPHTGSAPSVPPASSARPAGPGAAQAASAPVAGPGSAAAAASAAVAGSSARPAQAPAAAQAPGVKPQGASPAGPPPARPVSPRASTQPTPAPPVRELAARQPGSLEARGQARAESAVPLPLRVEVSASPDPRTRRSDSPAPVRRPVPAGTPPDELRTSGGSAPGSPRDPVDGSPGLRMSARQRASADPRATPAAAPAAVTPKGFARPLTPPAGKPVRPPTPLPVVNTDGDGDGDVTLVSAGRTKSPEPSEPVIETYLEIEADLPPESGLDPELESELALNIALGTGAPDSEDRSAAASGPGALAPGRGSRADHGDRGDRSGSEPVRQRTIGAQDSAAVSGTISLPDERSGPRRAKRHSDNLDD